MLQVGPNETNKENSKETNKETDKETADRIIEILETRPRISVNEIAKILGISVSGVRYHINKMKKTGLIEHTGSTKKGQWIVCK